MMMMIIIIIIIIIIITIMIMIIIIIIIIIIINIKMTIIIIIIIIILIILMNYIYKAHFHDRSCSKRLTSQNKLRIKLHTKNKVRITEKGTHKNWQNAMGKTHTLFQQGFKMLMEDASLIFLREIIPLSSS